MAKATVLRDAGLSDLLDGELETLAGGFVFTEGPLWCPADASLLVQDIKAAITYRISSDGSVAKVRERTEGANGQTYLPDGRVVFCEQDGRRVSRMARDGSGYEVLVERCQGQRLNSPNDIVCRSDGRIYFTDPPYGVTAETRELPYQGVFALADAGGGDLSLLVDDFEKPNGLAFSPDEQTLYICDTGRYHVRAFEVEPVGMLAAGSSRVFATLDPEGPGGPDGMKVDAEGRVYVAVAQGVWVFEPTGKLLGILETPKRPSNLAWCGDEGRQLAITAVDSVHRIALKVAGRLPQFQPMPS